MTGWICPKNCKHNNEAVIARRWINREEKWTGYCTKFQRLIICHDLGESGDGAKFTRCERCVKEVANPEADTE